MAKISVFFFVFLISEESTLSDAEPVTSRIGDSEKETCNSQGSRYGDIKNFLQNLDEMQSNSLTLSDKISSLQTIAAELKEDVQKAITSENYEETTCSSRS